MVRYKKIKIKIMITNIMYYVSIMSNCDLYDTYFYHVLKFLTSYNIPILNYKLKPHNYTCILLVIHY